MQALGPIGSIAVAEATHLLCEGYLSFKALGATRVKGVSDPVNVYQVTGLGPLRTRLQLAARRGLTRFVGRHREMEVLRRALDESRAGHGQVVAVVGDPGVGKSRLFYEFKAIAQSGCTVLETISVSHGKASAYLPVIELLNSYSVFAPEADLRRRREKGAGHVLALERALEDALPSIFSLLAISKDAQPSPPLQLDMTDPKG